MVSLEEKVSGMHDHSHTNNLTKIRAKRNAHEQSAITLTGYDQRTFAKISTNNSLRVVAYRLPIWTTLLEFGSQ